MESVGSVSAKVEQVLTQFDKVFEVPKDLPPQRSHDHQIPLMLNTLPINVRPYRHPPNQKDAIEVKEKFPILVMDELIDELNGSVVFSKLDLRCTLNFPKSDEYSFQGFLKEVEYLGHTISAQGVSIDPSKIEAMQKWPIPSTLKQLRGFIGLTGYYRRFIKDYTSISQPLVALTKKDAFKGNPSAELAYHKLKKAMVKALVLALPNFKQEFVVETDVSGKGIGAVLTDHFSLKYLLNQKLTTPFQFKWLPKLLRYDYEIVYKKGNKNVVADALSRMDLNRELLQIYLSSVSSGVWDKVKDSCKNDLDTHNLIKSLEHHSYKGNKYSWTGEILKRKEKVVVGNDLKLKKKLVQHFHDEAIGGHSGAHVTMKKLGSLFYWKEISMDFIERFPTSHGKSVILVVVERISKYAHFIPLTHPFTVSQVAQIFLDQVYKLHGLPESIVSDRDKVFLRNFWKALFAELKVKLKLSTAYHPQTDGQT
nr:hypothetical protein [Tanacetum cinerariifolium]